MTEDYAGFCRTMAANYLANAGVRRERVTDERQAVLADLREALHYLQRAIAELESR